MRTPRWLATWLVLTLLAAPMASGRDIHVNNLDGDDSFTGRRAGNLSDWSGPVRSIARALELAVQGDRIVLANSGEPYRESISLAGSRHSGDVLRPLVIEGNGAILDGSAPVPASRPGRFSVEFLALPGSRTPSPCFRQTTTRAFWRTGSPRPCSINPTSSETGPSSCSLWLSLVGKTESS